MNFSTNKYRKKDSKNISFTVLSYFWLCKCCEIKAKTRAFFQKRVASEIKDIGEKEFFFFGGGGNDARTR